MNDDDDFPLIDADDLSPLVEPDNIPPLTKWQEIEFSRLETDLLSGVAWQSGVSAAPAPMKSTAEARQKEVRMEVASWFLCAEKKFIKVNAPETRLGKEDVSKVVKPMMVVLHPESEPPRVQQWRDGAR